MAAMKNPSVVYQIEKKICLAIFFNLLQPGIQNGRHEKSACINWKKVHCFSYFQKSVVLEANRLEPRSGPTYVGLILSLACLQLFKNTDSSESRLKWAKYESHTSRDTGIMSNFLKPKHRFQNLNTRLGGQGQGQGHKGKDFGVHRNILTKGICVKNIRGLPQLKQKL